MIRRRRLVRLHLTDDRPSFEGVLVSARGGHYRLANARVFAAEGESYALDGEQWIPKGRVLYVQVLG
ncbi:MAG: hypothetical protein IT175_06110 [Acidobacteria bacterium]|nr:hypothetical protein [Acidobacteriota bacterium]